MLPTVNVQKRKRAEFQVKNLWFADLVKFPVIKTLKIESRGWNSIALCWQNIDKAKWALFVNNFQTALYFIADQVSELASLLFQIFDFFWIREK